LELSTITRIEQFLCDALIASPLIPIGVNVLRLADVIDKEGVINQTNNIVVRYTGASNKVKNRIPMVFERTMRFECNFSCQNYLTSSGHDFATQLLAGAFITLNGSVPGGAYVQVIEPFVCVSENFTGLTDQSQYTYTQEYELQIEEAMPYVALDPCVQRGDCRQVFPAANVDTRLPLGGVLEETTGDIYVPSYDFEVCGGSPEEDYDSCSGVRWSNELTQSGDWVFIANPDCVFLEDPLSKPIYFLSNRNYTEDGRLVVTMFDANTDEPIKEVFFCNTGRKLARYAVELWTDTVNKVTPISSKASKDAAWFQSLNYGEFAVVTGGYQFLYTDPFNPNAQVLSLDGGGLIGVQPETFIQTPKGRFYYVGQSPQGRGWMLEGTFELASINSLWRLGCPPCTNRLEQPHQPF
jgi:hypothetical protein